MNTPVITIIRSVTVLLCLSALGGCITSPPPPEVKRITLSKMSSPIITVWEVRWKKDEKGLGLTGLVLRHYPAAQEDTTHSHLLASFYDGQGNLLRETPAEFEPRRIRRGHRMPGLSTFSIPLPDLPANTDRITIRAFDELPH